MVLTRQCRQVSSSVLPFLPLFLRAPVVQGKKRGGKELGIPTGKITLNCYMYYKTPENTDVFTNGVPVYGTGPHFLSWYREVSTGTR